MCTNTTTTTVCKSKYGDFDSNDLVNTVLLPQCGEQKYMTPTHLVTLCCCYSYDSRTGDPGNKGLWSEPEAFGERAYFRVGQSPAVLSIKNLTKEDGGVYTCRLVPGCLTENEGI